VALAARQQAEAVARRFLDVVGELIGRPERIFQNIRSARFAVISSEAP
jgi:hypothetical protein